MGVAGNTTMNSDDIVVIIPDDGALLSTNTVTLPAAGEDGQVVWVVNDDVEAGMATFTGTILGPLSATFVTISPQRALGFVWSGGAWYPLSL